MAHVRRSTYSRPAFRRADRGTVTRRPIFQNALLPADYAPLIRRQYSLVACSRGKSILAPIVAETEFVITLDSHFSYYLLGPLLAPNGHADPLERSLLLGP